MSRYSVYANPDAEGYLLDVQADLLDHLNTRVVIPLMPIAIAPLPARTLNPSFEISNEYYILVTQFVATVPMSALRHPVLNLKHEHQAIVAALDLLLQGF
jgi:toxin CcdB